MAALRFSHHVRRVLPFFLFTCIVTLLLPALASAQAPAPNITVTIIGTPGRASAWDINDQGQVVGRSYTDDYQPHAFLWQDGTMTDLGTLGGTDSYAYAINNQGQVVGESATGTHVRAFLWQNGTMTDLGTLGGEYSSADDINDQGQVVGGARTGNESFHAFLWQNGTMTDLGTLSGIEAIFSHAYGINNQGQVVGGSVNFARGISHAFLWQNGTMTDLGTLGGNLSHPNDINDQGQVVGQSTTAAGDYHAFLWQNGTMTDLGTLGGRTSYAHGINNQGQIVGESETATGDWHAFLWQNGMMIDLGPGVARDINEQGQIAGEAREGAAIWTVGQPPQSPTAQVTALRAEVENLVDTGALKKGQGHALMTKLDGALQKLERGDTRAAANQMQAFVNQVEALQKAKKLTTAQAQPLLAQARNVIPQLM